MTFTDGSGKSITLSEQDSVCLANCEQTSKLSSTSYSVWITGGCKYCNCHFFRLCLSVICFTWKCRSLVSPSAASHTGYLISIPVSIGSWTGFGITFVLWRGSYGRSSIWQKSGLDKNVYDLIVKMRGGNSRLQLLRSLDSPKQRNELTLLTGIDWKEVDRNIGLLLSYGLVSIYAESGSVKIYKLTEQGRLLLKLIDEMNRWRRVPICRIM